MNAQAGQHVDQVLGGQVSRRPLCIGTASQSCHGRVHDTHSHLKTRMVEHGCHCGGSEPTKLVLVNLPLSGCLKFHSNYSFLQFMKIPLKETVPLFGS